MKNLNLLAVVALLVAAVFAPEAFAHASGVDLGMAGGLLIGLNTQMTPAQARVVDPILSNIAHGYRNPDVSRVGRLLFPRVIIPARGAQILEFGKESFRLFNTRRAPGAGTKRIQYGYAAGAVSLLQESLEATVPIEIMDEASKTPGVDMARGAVELVQDVFDRAEEYEQAQKATNAANYDSNHKIALSGTDLWTYPGSDPGLQMQVYREAVRASTGIYPNLLALSPAAFNALTVHPKIKAQFQYTSSDSITAEMLARYFSIAKVVVGTDVYLANADADTADFRDIWSNVAVLAYVPTNARYEVPSYGYTYHLAGHPMVEQPYYERNAKSWIYPMTYERQVNQTGKGAGFLIQNPAPAS